MLIKHVVITGVTGGLGSALAKTYAEEGVHLSLLGRKMDELNSIAMTCQRLGATASCYDADVTETENLIALLNTIDDEKSVDLVIANAGIVNFLSQNNPEETWTQINHLLNVNLSGAIATVSPFVDRMKKRKAGQIALISSISAYHGMEVMPSYCASKAGLKAYGEALRALLYKDGVKVSVVLPGFIKSNMSNQFLCSKPFLLTADKAASMIKSGLEKNKPRITFPFFMSMGMKLLTLLPCDFSSFILRVLGYKV